MTTKKRTTIERRSIHSTSSRRALQAASLALAVGLAGGGAGADALPGAPARSPELEARLERSLAARGPEHVPRSRHRLADGRPRFTNRLILETSPYLIQHAHNPLDWYPWGDAAFDAARRLGRPVLLSIGYSTCHWCHVMEEESFDDLEIAEYLNRNYIAIKVDREERPDIDAVYIAAVQLLTRRGAGWPLTVWLTPSREPFHGATYLPPRSGVRPGRPGFLETLRSARQLFDEQPDDMAARASDASAALQKMLSPPPSVAALGEATLADAFARYRAGYDSEHGGLRGRHKFPSSLSIPFLLRTHRRTGDAEALAMASTTLDAMRRGGIYDHVGGGFHRYTTEPTWTIPHFEKMLYDQALLVVAYSEAHEATGDAAYAAVVRDVLDYVAREMTSPLGTFYSASDADSDGEEGTFFVWTPAEIRAGAGAEDAPLALAAYGVTDRGNFEHGSSVLRRDAETRALAERFGTTVADVERRLSRVRARLRAVRAKRVPPHTDRKQLVAWNGLMISALARASITFGEADWSARAARAAGVLLERARPGGRLARYLMDDLPHGSGVLDDHALLEAGLIDLFEATGERRWLDAATELQAELDRRFAHPHGGYWRTASDAEALLAREKPFRDGARPSGNSVAALNLIRLYHLTADPAYAASAEMNLRSFADRLERQPTSVGTMLCALDFWLATPKEILIVTPGDRAAAEPFLRELRSLFLPNRVLAVVPEGEVAGLVDRMPILEFKRALDGRTTAYVCENRVCDLPAREPAVFRTQLLKRRAAVPEDPG